jgi:hypothetical protein
MKLMTHLGPKLTNSLALEGQVALAPLKEGLRTKQSCPRATVGHFWCNTH